MSHPSNATSLSKYLQQLGGRHVQNTGVTYKSSYWKVSNYLLDCLKFLNSDVCTSISRSCWCGGKSRYNFYFDLKT